MIDCADCGHHDCMYSPKEAKESDTISTPSGAKTSPSPRFDLLPHRALLRVAQRYEKGLARYGKNNWQKGLGDNEYAIERINHVIEHCYRLIDKLEGRSTDTDDDAGAIAWGGLFLCEFVANKEASVDIRQA